MSIDSLSEEFEEIYAQSLPTFKQNEILRIIILFAVLLIDGFLGFILIKSILYIGAIKKIHLFILLGMLFVWKFGKKFIEYYIKDTVMNSFIEPFGDLKWDMAEDFIKKEELKKSLIVPSFSEYEVDDEFKGSFHKYPNTEFIIQEMVLKQGLGIYKVPVFKGVIFKFFIPKHFEGHTIISEEKLLLSKEYKQIKLEDSEWEKQFNVYSDHQIESRYILTPLLMERIKTLKKIYSSKKVSISFRYGTVLVALDIGHDIFETCSLVKRIEDKASWKIMFFQIYYALKLYEQFLTKL